MIKLKKLSASSINTFDSCELKWFLQYTLGYRDPSGKAAVLGTICHYVLECIAKSKLVRQNGLTHMEDEIVGDIKAAYDIQKWTDTIYEYYTKLESHLTFVDKDYREVCLNIKKAQAHKLFPEKHPEIIQPESDFFLPIDKSWAKYSYMNEGEIEGGNIQLNGFIDLVFRDRRGTLNFIDYKFGSSTKDWATDKEKDTAHLIYDTQLCMYYWALRHQFPNEDIVANLWFVKVGKAFTHIFSPDQEVHLMAKVEATIARIKGMQKPQPRYTWKCNMCPFKKTNFESWGRSDLNISHSKMTDPHFGDVDGKGCVCDSTRVFLDYRGLEATIENGRFKSV